MGAMFSAARKASNKTGQAMERVGNTVPEIQETLNNANRALSTANEFISSLDGIPGHLTTTIEEVRENVSNTSASVAKVAKIGFGVTAFKYLSDLGVSLYQTVKLVRIASEARNDLKKFVDNTAKTEDEIVSILKDTEGDFKSFTNQFAEDIHKMGQDFGNITKSLPQSSNLSSDSVAHTYKTSRYFKVTCLSLVTSVLVASMVYLQNSSCYDNPQSMLCVTPSKGMAATAIAAGFLTLGMLMPKKSLVNDRFLIPEEGIDQHIELTKEVLDAIKTVNPEIFNLIEVKRQIGNKWDKYELEWLLSQDKNIFLKVLSGEAYASSDCLGNNIGSNVN